MSGKKQIRITNRCSTTAFHEAGHAVVACREGIAVNSATIVSTPDYRGLVTHADPLRGIRMDIEDTLRSRSRARALIRVCLAGHLAQKMKYPRSHFGGQDDFSTAADLITYIGTQNTTNAYMKLLELQTLDILNVFWFQVEALAQALLDQKSLSRKEVRKTILDARP